jgi:hypothetical protein
VWGKCIWGCCEVAVETNAGFVWCGVDGESRGLHSLDGLGWWSCGGSCVLSREVETRLVGEFAGPELVGGQTVVVWSWWKLLFVCQAANDVVACILHIVRLKWLVVKFSALQAGVQDSCACTSVSRKEFLLGGGGESR